MYILALREGVIQITPESVHQYQAPIENLADVYNAPVAGITWGTYKEMIGSGIWDTIKGIGSMAANIAKTIPIPQVQAVGNIASSLLGNGGRGGRGGVLASGGRNIGPRELRMIKQKKF